MHRVGYSFEIVWNGKKWYVIIPHMEMRIISYRLYTISYQIWYEFFACFFLMISFFSTFSSAEAKSRPIHLCLQRKHFLSHQKCFTPVPLLLLHLRPMLSCPGRAERLVPCCLYTRRSSSILGLFSTSLDRTVCARTHLCRLKLIRVPEHFLVDNSPVASLRHFLLCSLLPGLQCRLFDPRQTNFTCRFLQTSVRPRYKTLTHINGLVLQFCQKTNVRTSFPRSWAPLCTRVWPVRDGKLVDFVEMMMMMMGINFTGKRPCTT